MQRIKGQVRIWTVTQRKQDQGISEMQGIDLHTSGRIMLREDILQIGG